MADSWQTIEQAAVSLRLSVRTVNRHMAAGKLQSRLNAEGRREVFVSLPDTPASELSPSPFSDTPAAGLPPLVSDNVTSTVPAAAPESSTFNPVPSPPVSLDPETVLALADNAAQKADMAVTAYQTLARLADTQVRQVRRQARLAWAAVALMAAGVTVAVGWTTHRLTRAAADAGHLATQLQQLQNQAIESAQAVRQQAANLETARTESEASQSALRTELAAAREEAARVQGSLAAYKDQEVARQTPEGLVEAETSLQSTTRPVPPQLAEALARFLEPGGWASRLSSDASDTDTARLASESSAPKLVVGKPASPTTKPLALHRKALKPTTRPIPVSDAQSDSSSASTDSDK